MAADPIEERDIEKLLKMLDDPRVIQKVCSKLQIEMDVASDTRRPRILITPKGPEHP